MQDLLGSQYQRHSCPNSGWLVAGVIENIPSIFLAIDVNLIYIDEW